MFSVQIQGGKPIYEQLEDRITELIISGEMATNEKLPAVREVARMLAINPNTVQKTYQRLEQRGFIYSVPAKGSYVCDIGAISAEVKEKAAAEFSTAADDAMKHGLTKNELISIIENK